MQGGEGKERACGPLPRLLLGYLLVVVFSLGRIAGGPSTQPSTAALSQPVQVQVSYWNASVVVQVPCDALSKGTARALDRSSPLIDVIPRYSNDIAVQTLEGCHEGVGGASKAAFVEELLSFLRYMFPLSNVRHEMIPSGVPFPPLAGGAAGANSSYDALVAHSVPLAGLYESNSRNLPCNNVRGRRGKWVYNVTYGESTWYIPGNGAEKAWIKSPFTSGPYNHSSWSWEPDEPHCPIDLLTFRGFCREMHALNVTRMFVLGDSIEFMRLVSFFHLMGLVSNVQTHLQGRKPNQRGYMRYSYKFNCLSEAGSQLVVDLVFYRTNHLMPVLGNETHPERWHRHKQEHELFVCYGILFNGEPPDENGWCPWVEEYLGSSKRTLLISGVGAHFHDMYYFQESMQRFFSLLRQHKRPDDIVLLRTVLTGHENCDSPQLPIDPLASFDQYRENFQTPLNTDSKRWYGWELYEMFNQHMEAEVMKIQRDPYWASARIELLDIYWMTALRRDGHPSNKDCLHYLLPGPPDWWNHLFYSNLKELANSQA